jgi:DNA invertase Pin-like site-specific DNA recombinase
MVPDVRCISHARLPTQVDDLLGEPAIGRLAELQPRVCRLALTASGFGPAGRTLPLPMRTSVLGYARVSTSEQSVEAQETAIRDECKRRGWQLLDVIVDHAHSGDTLDRPGLRTALSRIARGDAAGLVSARLDRVSRSTIDLGDLLVWFKDRRAMLVALDLGIDTSTASGRLVATVIGAVAEWERDTIAARTREGLAVIRAQGRPIGRPAVADNPELAARIRSMHDAGMSLRTIAKQLNTEGVPTLRGAAQWRPSSVQTAVGYRRPPVQRRRLDLPLA